MTEIIDNVQRSFARCWRTGDVLGRFYENFFDSHPDIRPKFINTNLDKQKQLLQQSVNLAILFADDVSYAKNGIGRIRKTHSKSNLNIPPNLYPYWKKSLIDAISEFDPEFTSQLAKEWDRVLQQTIDYVIEGYNE